MAKKSLNEQAVEILRIAEETGVQTNFFFVTTFNRYQELRLSFDMADYRRFFRAFHP